MEKLIKLISCPISKKIFNSPMLASDGIVYEAEILYDLINSDKESPVSNVKLDLNIKIPKALKMFINDFIKNNGDYEELQYKTDFNLKKMYNFNKIEIMTIFSDRSNYDKLLDYDNFILSDIEGNNFKRFLELASNETVIHFLDNCESLDYNWNNINIVNYVMEYGNYSVIEHLIKNYPNLNYENPCNGYSPIHILASRDSDNVIKLLIDLGINLFAKTNDGITGFEYILNNRSSEIIEHVINKIDSIGDLQLIFLFIRIDDNQNIDDDDKDRLKCLLNEKFN